MVGGSTNKDMEDRNMKNWYKLSQQEENYPVFNWKDKEEMWKEIERFYPDPNSRYRSHSDSRSNFMDEYNKKEFFINNFSFAIPSKEAIEELVKWIGGSRVIEIGAGRGLWARLLSEEGVSVEASDISHIKDNKFFNFNEQENDDKEKHKTYFEIKEISGEEHAKTGTTNDVLMMVWPYFEGSLEKEDWQSLALKNFKGSKFIFIGESEYGATGSPALWNEIRKNWITERYISIPNWRGISDAIQLYRRK